MISGAEIKVSDKNSEFYGVSTAVLMENAGKGVADFILKNLKIKDKKIIVFCGTGNNGGDGFVAARYLSKSNRVTVFLTGKEKDIKTKISKDNFQKLKKIKLSVLDINSVNKIDNFLSENQLTGLLKADSRYSNYKDCLLFDLPLRYSDILSFGIGNRKPAKQRSSVGVPRHAGFLQYS